MLPNPARFFGPAVLERVVLLANHVIRAEPAAAARLAPHAGRVVEVVATGWPALLPPLAPMAFRITPAGLLEWCGGEPPAQTDLLLRIDASNPALLLGRAAAGQPPAVAIDGDAQLAADANWLLQNLRWDIAGDLQRLSGPAVAHALHSVGTALAQALRAAVQGAGTLGSRLRP